MTRQEFIQQVMTVLNEAEAVVEGSEMIGSDMTKVELYAERLFGAAWRRAVMILPKHYFRSVSFLTAERVEDKPDGTGYVILPDDFLLLSVFKMKEWKAAVYDAFEATPEIDAVQMNEYTRGNIYRPVCVIRTEEYRKKLTETEIVPDVEIVDDDTVLHKEPTLNNVGNIFKLTGKTVRALYYYSVPKTDENDESFEIEQALYIPLVEKLTDDVMKTINDKLIEPLAYLVAAQVLTSFEKTEAAKAIDERVRQMGV